MKYRSLLIYGYHGRRNFGDDLFLDVITSKLNQIYGITKFFVSSPNVVSEVNNFIHPSQFDLIKILKKRYIISRLMWLDIFLSALRTDGIVFCAGSIFSIQPFFLILFVLSTLRLVKGRNFSLIAVGVSSGPYKSQRERKLAHACLKMMDHVQVRDPASEADLADVLPSEKLTRSFDIALMSPCIWSADIDRLPRPSQGDLTVGVCLHRRSTEFAGGQLADFFSQTIETLRLAGASVILLVACTDTEDGDLTTAEQLALDLVQVGLKSKIATYAPEAIESFLATMRSCDCIVTSRMHVAVAALASAIPVLQINYAEKAAQFFASHEMPMDNIANADKLFQNKLLYLIDNCRNRCIVNQSRVSRLKLREEKTKVERETNTTLSFIYR